MKTKENFSLPVIHEALIPMAFLEHADSRSTGTVLAADVGGTKTNLALFQAKDGKLTAVKEKSCHTREHTSFVAMVRYFLGKELSGIDAICLGVAGPVTQGKVHGTNFPWDIDTKEIGRELHIPSVSLINDMEANAYGLAALREKDFETLKYGPVIPGNAALIAPGTGLEEAGLFWDGSYYHPFATEGGHCDFSPRNEVDV